jgi:hypothetical protein
MRSLFVIAIIRLTRFRYARGIVVSQYYRCRIVVWATFDDLSRAGSSYINSAAKKLSSFTTWC